MFCNKLLVNISLVENNVFFFPKSDQTSYFFNIINRDIRLIHIINLFGKIERSRFLCVFLSHTAWQISLKRRKRNTAPRRSTGLPITKRRLVSLAHRWIMVLVIATVDLTSSLFSCWPHQGRNCLLVVLGKLKRSLNFSWNIRWD